MKETLAIPSVAFFIAYSQFESKGKVFMDKWVRDVYIHLSTSMCVWCIEMKELVE